jgi:hypothetical protein
MSVHTQILSGRSSGRIRGLFLATVLNIGVDSFSNHGAFASYAASSFLFKREVLQYAELVTIDVEWVASLNLSPWYRGTMVPWYRGTEVPRYRGTEVPGYRGTVVPDPLSAL